MRAWWLPGLLMACALAASAAAGATNVYGWVDRDGNPQYADRAGVGEHVADAREVVLAEPAATRALPVARLHLVHADGGEEAWAENLLDGPIEVMLVADSAATPRAEPALPARATVPPRTRVLVARVAAPTAPASSTRLSLRAVAGQPGIRHRDIEYAYPLQSRSVQLGQGWGGAFSHGDVESRHAVDFAAVVGTPVLAAREGVVMQLETVFARGGLGDGIDATQANFVRILHDDGSMALYAHLDAGGVHVRQGQRVRRGQPIGLSGNTGYSGGPHLHFVVQANQGMRLVSLPFRMFGPDGILRFAPAAPAARVNNISPAR